MARVIFEGLTVEQAKCLAQWYEGQGEQDSGEWFDIHEIPHPYTDADKGFYEVQPNGDVIVFCKSE